MSASGSTAALRSGAPVASGGGRDPLGWLVAAALAAMLVAALALGAAP